MTIREEIAEIIREANLFYHKGLSVEEVADEILNIKREVRCPECKGRGLKEGKKLVYIRAKPGEIIEESNLYECRNCKSGYILKTLGEIVG